MLTFLEGHPNTDAMVLYVIAAVAMAMLLYRFHRKQA